jgi:hypothetical protein
MKAPHPNLFEALFDFHPREGHTPKENFLTESFAYLLRTEQSVLDQWLSKLLRTNAERVTCNINTRQPEDNSETATLIYPDMVIDGQLSDQKLFAVYCEHKWDSPCDPKQLKRYRNMVEQKGNHARLVFVGATHKQRLEAVGCLQDNVNDCFLWEEVFSTLDVLPEKSKILKEFLDFMKNHGLSPARLLTVERMKAYPQASDCMDSLKNLANKLHTDYSWKAIPQCFFASNGVYDAWGRVAIRLATEGKRPVMALGFLYDGEIDHKVTLINPDKGFDLLLRIEASPGKNQSSILPVLDLLKAKRDELKQKAASVLCKGDSGNGNKHTMLIVRDCLADVIENAKTEAEQLEAIHKKLTTWLDILFSDGKIEKALQQPSLDLGMS